MKIRIVQSGYETFTGLLGDVSFQDGVSKKDVSDQQAAYVGAMFTCESFEDEAPQEPQESQEPQEPQAPVDEAPSQEQNGEETPEPTPEVTSEGQAPAAE